MPLKKIAITALVAAALALAAAFMLWREKPAAPSRPLAKLKPEDISRIEIDYNREHVVLERAGEKWRLAAPVEDEADAAAADELSQRLRDMALDSEVSRDPASQADYEVNEASAARVRVYSRASAAAVLDGYFGKAAMGSFSYFRPNREAAVYMAEGVASHLLRRGADELRGKNLLTLSLNELQTLRFSQKGGFALTKSSGSWAAAGRKLSADQASEIVLAVSSLRFANFAPAGVTDKKAGLDKPVVDFTAAGGGRSERILIGREDAGRRYAKVEGRKALGFVSKYDADALLKLLKP